MHKAFSATTDATPDELFAVVGDLGTYPDWLDVVDSVEETDDPNAWIVTLKARVGPFSRSKRLRMVRTEPVGRSVRFVRHETDGKSHSAWNLSADVTELETGSDVALDLEYGGAMWTGLLDGVLDAAADRATDRLRQYLQSLRR